MAKSELIVGLDIGTTKICTVVGEAGADGIVDIIGIGTSPSTGLRKGVVVNIEQTVQYIKKALEEADVPPALGARAKGGWDDILVDFFQDLRRSDVTVQQSKRFGAHQRKKIDRKSVV